jgi:rubrerythrin
MDTSSSQKRTDHTLMREIYRAYLDELSAIVGYTHAAIAFDPYFHTVAALFAEIAEDEMHHFAALGELLRDHGAPFAVDLRLRQAPIRTEGKSDAERAALVRQLLNESLADEQQAGENYKRLAAWSRNVEMQRLLTAIAADEARHADALSSALARLERS